MAGASKNNPTNRKESGNMRFVTSYDCENCKTQCLKGLNYLSVFSKRGQGRGVACEKK